MRLWSIHPRYLDARGLVALWREGLLAQAVLRRRTRGYRHHPQLIRFKQHPQPLAAICSYLQVVYWEAKGRGYAFDRSKIRTVKKKIVMQVSRGQMQHEWRHLLRKLKRRDPEAWRGCSKLARPRPHPLFRVRPGPVEPWEK